MKHCKTVISIFLLIAVIMTSSCAMFLADHGTFDGGEILDDGKMSEIRSKVFGSDLTEAEEITTNESTSSHSTDKVESETIHI